MKSNIQFSGLGSVFVITGLFKFCWNKLMPSLFNLKKLTYWQSVMLAVIVKSLFGSSLNIKDSFNAGNTVNGASKKTAKKKAEKITEKVEEPKVEVCIEEDCSCNCEEEKKEDENTEIEENKVEVVIEEKE